jgi:flavodoxin I
MKTLIVYDSGFGNTEKIAHAIGGAMTGDVRVARVGEVRPEDLKGLNFLVVGSPTQGGRATPAIRDFIGKIPKDGLKGINVSAFDTRLPGRLVGIFGYAAGRIAPGLKKKGGNLISPPEGFIVQGSEGPLKQGELERAAAWAKQIAT